MWSLPATQREVELGHSAAELAPSSAHVNDVCVTAAFVFVIVVVRVSTVTRPGWAGLLVPDV